jgi:anti-sigma-K factor RskA
MNCERTDELAAAYALGAVDPAEERAISAHLAGCPEPHAEARALVDAAAAVPLQLEPVRPDARLRARLMATVAATAQDHRPAAAPAIRREGASEPRPIGRSWWQVGSPLMAAMAAGALALAVGLGAWNISLQQEIASRDAALRTVAGADDAHQVTGSVGSGWLLETDGEAVFVAEGLASLASDRIYELWLIEPDGVPVAVGTVDRVDDVTVVPLERDIGEATTFAVTVEEERVDAPTSDPVLVASLEG